MIIEWWRARNDIAEKIIGPFDIEPPHTALPRPAGEAIAALNGGTLADAVVIALAARRGDVV